MSEKQIYKTYQEENVSERLINFLFLIPKRSPIVWGIFSVICAIVIFFPSSFLNRNPPMLVLNSVTFFIFMAAVFYFTNKTLIIKKDIEGLENIQLVFKSLSYKQIKEKIIQFKWDNIKEKDIIVNTMNLCKQKFNQPEILLTESLKAGQYPIKKKQIFENSAMLNGFLGTILELSIMANHVSYMSFPYSCLLVGLILYLLIVLMRFNYEKNHSIFQSNYNAFHTNTLTPVILNKPDEIELTHFSEQLTTTSTKLVEATNGINHLIATVSQNEEIYLSLGEQLLESVRHLSQNQADINKFFDKFAQALDKFTSHSNAVEGAQKATAEKLEDFVKEMADAKSLLETFNSGVNRLGQSFEKGILENTEKIKEEAERQKQIRNKMMNDSKEKMQKFIDVFETRSKELILKLSSTTRNLSHEG